MRAISQQALSPTSRSLSDDAHTTHRPGQIWGVRRLSVTVAGLGCEPLAYDGAKTSIAGPCAAVYDRCSASAHPESSYRRSIRPAPCAVASIALVMIPGFEDAHIFPNQRCGVFKQTGCRQLEDRFDARHALEACVDSVYGRSSW